MKHVRSKKRRQGEEGGRKRKEEGRDGKSHRRTIEERKKESISFFLPCNVQVTQGKDKEM